MKKKLSVSLVLVLGFILAACGGPKIEGKWESVYSKMEDSYKYEVGYISLNIGEDKTITAVNGGVLKGTWAKESDKYIIVFDDAEGSAVFEGELLVITTPDGAVYYFARDSKNFNAFPDGTRGVPKG